MASQPAIKRTAFLIALLSLALIGSATLPALAAAGPPSGAIYADNNVFQTVGTPTTLPHSQGQPFDQLYRFVTSVPPGAPATDQQYPLSDYGPGDQGFVGGRWHVILVVDASGNPVTGYDFAAHPITNLSQYQSVKASQGWTEISTTVYFECPLILVH